MKKLRVGLMGCGGRGREHAQEEAGRPPDEFIKARDPVRRALRKLLDRSVFPGPDGYCLGEPPPSAP